MQTEDAYSCGFTVKKGLFMTTKAPRVFCLRLLALWLFFTYFAAAVADPIPIEAFVRRPEFSNLHLSPDGKYVAGIVPDEKHSRLVVIRTADRKMVGNMRMQDDIHIGYCWWVSNDRLLAGITRQVGLLDRPRFTGDLFSVKPDGSEYRQFGFGGASFDLVDRQADAEGRVLIAGSGYSNHYETTERLFRVAINRPGQSEVDAAPSRGGARFLIDPQRNVRYVTVELGDTETAYTRLPGQREWKQVSTERSFASTRSTPLRFAPDGESVYLVSNESEPRTCLVQQILATGERRKLACDDQADLSAPVYGFGEFARPIAAVFEAGKPETRLLETESPDARIYKMLMEAFPGKRVVISSSTTDGSLALLFVYDDRTPGDYYLFDTRTQKADYFVGRQDWIDPDLMAERRPIQLKARDGTTLWGYLTLPRGVDPKQLPLVVNPHGGPFFIRDDWAFEAESQMLASRGYAVLQVNYRGSGGYGSAFVEAGRRAWGTTMIDDITDATRWVISQGYADPKRVCIYGGSYGAYAAVTSAEREPDLYRCVIGYAGVYDLRLLKSHYDSYAKPTGLDFFAEAIAGSNEEIDAQSPVEHVDRLKAPVLIVHGEEDYTAPYPQAMALRDALKDHKLPFEWMVREGEGHGFWKTENRVAFYQSMLAFLDKNIGQGSMPGQVPQAAAAASAAPP